MNNICKKCNLDLIKLNYCTTKSNESYCYNCVQKINLDDYDMICKNVKNVIQNIPIIHLDKYEDDFSFYDYFLRRKNNFHH